MILDVTLSNDVSNIMVVGENVVHIDKFGNLFVDLRISCPCKWKHYLLPLLFILYSETFLHSQKKNTFDILHRITIYVTYAKLTHIFELALCSSSSDWLTILQLAQFVPHFHKLLLVPDKIESISKLLFFPKLYRINVNGISSPGLIYFTELMSCGH